MKDNIVIQKLGERIEAALKIQFGVNHRDEEEQLGLQLADKLPLLQLLSVRHVDILNKFKMTNPAVEFPALHKELFSSDGLESP